MKNTVTLLAAALLIISCKKDYHPLPNPVPVKQWVVTTIAGNGAAASTDGSAITASFHFPEDVVVTPSGVLYVTEAAGHRIRKISSGIVSTFAGNDNFGIVDDLGILAQFKSPFSIVMDANGNLYTSDDNDNRIRKITPAGQVSTYATLSNNGSYLAIDPNGNLFASEPYDNRIQKIAPNGDITTINNISLSFPGAIVRDKDGNIYVADRGTNRLKKITPNGAVSNFAGSGTSGNADGDANSARFSPDMSDMVIDSKGNIIMGHFFLIRKITPQGNVSTIAGTDLGFQDGPGTMARFSLPGGLAIDANDNIYIADIGSHRIRKLSFE